MESCRMFGRLTATKAMLPSKLPCSRSGTSPKECLMSKELIVSSTAHETKVAIIEDDQVVEVYFEREQEYSLAGSIFKGRVTRVLPGMQSAFVNIGLERDAFLYVSDFRSEEHTSELQSLRHLVCRLLLEKKK